MNVRDAIRGRRSIRRFQDKPVPRELIGEMLDACKWAPSSGNKQPWEVIVVEDEEKKEELVEAAMGQKFVGWAPVVLVVCRNTKLSEHYGERGRDLYSIQDTAIAAQNMMLRAHSLGLGTCWVGAFDEERVSDAVNLPEDVIPVSVMPVGWPDESPRPPLRHEITDFSYLNEYGRPMEEKWKNDWRGLEKECKEKKRKMKKVGKKFLESLKKF
jgi:nitroreductase